MSPVFPKTRRTAHTALVLTCSLAVHGLLLTGLRGAAHASVAKPSPMRVTVVSEPQLPPPAPPEQPAAELAPVAEAPAATRRETRRSEPKRTKAAKAPPPESADAPPPAAEGPAEAVDFTGVTLTSGGSGSWTSAVGDGQSGSGVIGAPGRGRGGHGSGSGEGAGGGGDGPRVVGLASLSKPPRAPNLNDALRSHYPARARDAGHAGQAVVRARILSDGRVERTVVLSASAPEFGKACQATLEGSRWSAPLDAKGIPVATDISYTCRFEVDG